MSRGSARRRRQTPRRGSSSHRDRRSGSHPSRRARTTAAASTQAIARSASVTSIEVDPTSTESVGWYVAWRKRNGTAAASTSASHARPRGPARPRRTGAPGGAARPSPADCSEAIDRRCAAAARAERGSTLTRPMAPSLFRRRFATAAGLYLSVGLGIVGTIAAARLLGLEAFGRFATVMAVVGLAQTLLDLTVEESLTKFGFRYIAGEEWGKLHRLFRRALELKLVGGALASLAPARARAARRHRVRLRRAHRADARGGGAAADRVARERERERAPPPRPLRPSRRAPLGDDGDPARRDPDRRVVRRHGGACRDRRRPARRDGGRGHGGHARAAAVPAGRGRVARRRPPRDRLVRRPLERRHRRDLAARRAHARPARRRRGHDAGRLPTASRSLRRAASRRRARPSGSCCSPSRRATGSTAARPVLRGVRRYSLAAAGIAAVAVPVFLVAHAVARAGRLRQEYLPAVDAARIVLVSAAILLVLGWSKSLPVTIGRPRLRIVTHGIETLVLLPLVVVLGARVGGDRRRGRDPDRDARVRRGLGGRARPAARGAAGARAARGADRGRPVRVVVVSGIWPPDVGGPGEPRARARAGAPSSAGHEVEVVTTADAEPADAAVPRRVGVRGLPAPGAPPRGRAGRRAAAPRRGPRVRDDDDPACCARRALARRPLVVKLVADEVFERERRSGRFTGSLEEFQRCRGGVRVRALRATRNAALRRARRVVVPSAYLRDIALGWGLDPARVVGRPEPGAAARRRCRRATEARAALGLAGPALATAGPADRAEGARRRARRRRACRRRVELLVLGDGPERARLERRATSSGSATASGSSARVARGRPRASSAPSTPPCSPRRGRTCRTRCSRRWPSGTPVDRDGGRWRSRGRPRRRERAARAGPRRRSDRGRDRAHRSRRRRCVSGSPRARPPSVEELAEPRILRRIVAGDRGSGE